MRFSIKSLLFLFLCIPYVHTEAARSSARLNKILGHVALSKDHGDSASSLESFPCVGMSTDTVAALEKALSAGPVTLSLSSIIESNLAGENLLFTTTVANPIRRAMAEKWVRNAATRIFHDKARSVLEIVVNSFDVMLAMQGKPVTGKFGMGFFSIFSLLDNADTGGARIIIKTAYATPKGLQTYSMTMERSTDNPKDIAITFATIDPIELHNAPGTIVSIVPKNPTKNFDQAMLDAVIRYLYYLDFHHHGAIQLMHKQAGKTVVSIVGEQHPKASIAIPVKVIGSEITVQDAGFGIPLDIALSKLLIPSSSTKVTTQEIILDQKIALSQPLRPARLVIFKGKKDQESSHFLLEINGVVVVNKQLKRTIHDHRGAIKDVLISMPQVTQLTLARDEVYIKPAGAGFEEAYLKQIIHAAIASAFQISSKDARDEILQNQAVVAALYTGFEGWEEQTAADHIKGMFTAYIKKTVADFLAANPQVTPVHPDYYSSLLPIVRFIQEHAAAPSASIVIPLAPVLVSYSYASFERWIKNGFERISAKNSQEQALLTDGINGEIVSGKQLFFVPDHLLQERRSDKATIKEYGLRRSLLVPYSFLQDALAKNRDAEGARYLLANTIVGRYGATVLSPFTKKQSAEVASIVLGSATSKEYGYNSLVVTSDDALAESFLAQQHLLFVNNVRPRTHYHVDLGSIITCYDKECRVPTHRHNHTKKEGFCSTLELNTIYQIMDVDYLTRTVLHCMEGIVAYTKNSHHEAARSGHGAPKVLENIFTYGFILHPTAGYYVKACSSLGDYLVLDLIPRLVKCATSVEWKSLTKEQQHELIKPIIIYFVSIPTIFIQAHPASIVNDIFASLRSNYQNSHNNYNRFDTFLFDTHSGRQLWPLPTPATLESLNALFYKLASDHDFTTRPSTGLEKSPIVICKNLSPHIARLATAKKHDELSASLDYQRMLSKVVSKYDISIPHQLIPFLLLYLEVQESTLLSPDYKSTYAELRRSMLNLYKQHYHVSDDDITYNYGKTTDIRGITPQPDVGVTDIVALLHHLKDAPRAYNKLLEFQLDDFVFQTDKTLSQKDVSFSKKMYMPSIASNTPLSVLARLLQQGLHPTYLPLIIENSRTPAELMLVCYALIAPNSQSLITHTFRTPHNSLENALRLVIAHFIREKVDPDRIEHIYQSNRVQERFYDRLMYLKKEPIYVLIQNYLQEAITNIEHVKTRANFLSDRAVGALATEQPFTLQQLINAHCSSQGLAPLLAKRQEEETFAQIMRHIHQQTSTLDMGKIEQAVEAGSEKNPINATLTECLQNSVDVIKQFVAGIARNDTVYDATRRERSKVGSTSWQQDAATITYNVATVAGKKAGNNHLDITIHDAIGFPSLQTLVTDFLLPDFSSKTPGAGNIGDMGNGLFKMYQQAEMVSVITRLIENPGRVYWLTITPQRNVLSGRVENLSIVLKDISKEYVSSSKAFFGTSIRVLFREESIATNDMTILHIKDFLQNAMGTVSVPLNRDQSVCINLNAGGKTVHINKPSTPVLRHSVEDGKQITISKRENALLQSYVTTGGIPFRTLASFGKQLHLLPPDILRELSYGYIIDLPIGFYEPVQSRTQLQIKPENLTVFKQVLLDHYYTVGLEMGEKNENFLEKAFVHFGSSNVGLEQVRLTEHDNKAFQATCAAVLKHEPRASFDQTSFFTYFRPSWMSTLPCKSFYDYLTHAYTTTLVPRYTAISHAYEKACEEWHRVNKTDITRGAKYSDERKRLREKLGVINTEYSRKMKLAFNDWERVFGGMPISDDGTDPRVAHLKRLVIIPWFAKKIPVCDNGVKFPPIKNSYRYRGNEALLKVSTNLMHYSLTSYCKYFADLINVPAKNLCDAQFIFEDSSRAGWYSPQTKTLYINLKFVSCVDYMHLLMHVLNDATTRIKTDPIYIKLFDNAPGLDATVTHELEHARRGDDHKGFHSPSEDAFGKTVNFRACANSYSIKAQENGLLTMWGRSVKDHLVNTTPMKNIPIFIKQLQNEMSSIQDFEANNKEGLCEMIVKAKPSPTKFISKL